VTPHIGFPARIVASRKNYHSQKTMVGLKNSAQNERYVSGIFSL